MSRILLFLLILAIFISCDRRNRIFEPLPSSSPAINFVNKLNETDDFNILDYLYFYNGGGVAVGDINNDGLPDIFLSGNQVKNALYLNKGDLKFEDITSSAGVAGDSDWNTGAVMGDINGDGWFDIYVCAVVGLRGLDGHNELYINNGDNTFSEKSSEYGLDFDSYSSSAAFLDYDLDGDLDIYLLNHAVHTQESFGNADLRNERRYETGDKLLRNEGGSFTDVSEEAGIFGGVNGYGLGIAVSDFNQDGYPDIYVGNDFHEDDYFYLNKGDGTFEESLKTYFGHISRFSMGSDAADINHDGRVDLISLDMLPEDEKVLKSSEGDDDVNIQRLRTQQYGYHYQYSRNMLFFNQGENYFMETALMSGVAATDWSWSALFADFNQDGHQDLFIANGIPRRPNDLDYIRFVSSEQIRSKIDNTKLVDQEALELMPSGATANYLFEGDGHMTFTDRSDEWLSDKKTFSTAVALGDLDNDGDLDMVINNVEASPDLLINQTDQSSNYLQLSFALKGANKFGIGTKVSAYIGGELHFKELYTVRGFQASSEPMLHFGLGNAEVVDSLQIITPDKRVIMLRNVLANQELVITGDETGEERSSAPTVPSLFRKVDDNLGITFLHKEDRYIDFDRQPLMPYQISDRGPATAIGDLNGDGRDDVFFGGSKLIPSAVFMQENGIFGEVAVPVFASDSVKEDVAASLQDFDSDGRLDLVAGSGGGDFYAQMKPLLDSYFPQTKEGFILGSLPDYFENASVLKAGDYDVDGDLDLFVGNQAVSNDFGSIPSSFLLSNDKGSFSLVENEALQKAGMVTDAVWSDYDSDGDLDLILVGEWMSPTFFRNESGALVMDPLLSELNGLWQLIVPFDMDADGDVDYVLGNWGLNTKYKASTDYPLRMYYGDLDQNGSTETIIATQKAGKYYPIDGLDQLAGQLIHLRKKFTRYQDFAGKTLTQVFDAKELDRMGVLEVHELRSGYLKNENGSFAFHPLKEPLQVAPLLAAVAHDFDMDGREELLIGGNYFGVKPFHGRFDSFPGALVRTESDFTLGSSLGLDFMNRSLRDLSILVAGDRKYLLGTFNDDKAQVYQFGQ